MCHIYQLYRYSSPEFCFVIRMCYEFLIPISLIIGRDISLHGPRFKVGVKFEVLGSFFEESFWIDFSY